jgi:hypothetical protein
MDKCLQISDVSLIAKIATLEEVILPERAVGVEQLRDALPNLRLISYTYDLISGRPACNVTAFWREYHDLRWLAALRSTTVATEASQTADGTWNVSIEDSAFADVTVLKGARISELSLTGSGVSDVQPLTSLPLRRLRMDNTPGCDVGPLRSLIDLESIVLPTKAEGVEALRSLPKLKRIGYQVASDGQPTSTASAFWMRFGKAGE